MKNFEKIKEIHEYFKYGDIRCYVELTRLKINFEIEDDELSFELQAEASQRLKEIAERLIAEGKSYLVGDENYINSKEYLKESILIKVNVKDLHKKNAFNIGINLDEDGEIGSITCPPSYFEQKEYAKKIIKNWLKKEFGSI